jgi:transcriptional regulator with XRE-family HTH domain
MRRMMLGMSQEQLGEALGLTFQQVQKYEKGTNRVSASRLQQMAHILKVPITFFFEGAPGYDETGQYPPFSGYVTEFLATKDGLVLCNAFTRIADGTIKRAIVDLVATIADR